MNHDLDFAVAYSRRNGDGLHVLRRDRGSQRRVVSPCGSQAGAVALFVRSENSRLVLLRSFGANPQNLRARSAVANKRSSARDYRPGRGLDGDVLQHESPAQLNAAGCCWTRACREDGDGRAAVCEPRLVDRLLSLCSQKKLECPNRLRSAFLHLGSKILQVDLLI